MNKFYDLALVDKCSGDMVATWAGLECTFRDALLNLMRRAEGKIPPSAHKLIVMYIENPGMGTSDVRYGYVVRSTSEVKSF